ncbi:MAG: hypothetical protein Q9165_001933 [Trypethelium subeluteriae]
MRCFALAAALSLLHIWHAGAIDLDIRDESSIKAAAKTITGDIVNIFNGSDNSNVGLFPKAYSWSESAIIWDAFIDYWFLTGDGQYNDLVSGSILSQQGPNLDFMPVNQTASEGNDDQAFWGLAAMSAGERAFPVLSGQSTWLTLAENVFNEQAARWDNQSCNGGLRWQIFTFNNGYDEKTSLANALFFQLAARLAQFTGNQTYVTWADQTFTWLQNSGLITPDYVAWSSTSVSSNCSSFNHIQWSANFSPLISGSAILSNITNGTQQTTWQTRTQGLLSATSPWFSSPSSSSNSSSSSSSSPSTPKNILYEAACEPSQTCTADTLTYKGLLASSLAQTALFDPANAARILPILQASAPAAAQSCSGKTAASQSACGVSWLGGGFDGDSGLSQEYAALSAVLALLVPGGQKFANVSAPVGGATATGGAGSGSGNGNGNGTATGGTSSPTASGKSSGAEGRGRTMGVVGWAGIGMVALWLLC